MVAEPVMADVLVAVHALVALGHEVVGRAGDAAVIDERFDVRTEIPVDDPLGEKRFSEALRRVVDEVLRP